jgi:chromatin assembly factor 1 subunit B
MSDGVIILWKKMDTLAPRVQSELADDQDESQWEQESWRQVRSLRYHISFLTSFVQFHEFHLCTSLSGHPQDVYDISWSPTSEFLLSGSLDHTAIVWDLSGAQRMLIFLCLLVDSLFISSFFVALPAKQSQWLNQHTHYVQGVAWDPFDEMIATQSCDRTVKIYKRPVTAYATAAAPIPTIKAEDSVGTAATASSDVQSAEGNAAAEASKPKPKTVNKLGTFVPVASLARRRFDSARSSKKTSTANQSASTSSVSATAATTATVATAATVATEPVPVPAAVDDESDHSDMEDIADAENADRKTPQTHQLFLDETVQTYVSFQFFIVQLLSFTSFPFSLSFFRRLDWSPDGMLLATPTGQYFDQPAPSESEVQPGKAQQALYLFHRGDFARFCSPFAAFHLTQFV